MLIVAQKHVNIAKRILEVNNIPVRIAVAKSYTQEKYIKMLETTNNSLKRRVHDLDNVISRFASISDTTQEDSLFPPNEGSLGFDF